jgi:acyl carrier protein
LIYKKGFAKAAEFNKLGDDSMLDGRPSLTRDRLLALVDQILVKNAVVRPVSVNDPLTAAGLSSVDMVQLMLAVEADFDITIAATDITPEHFRSIATIEALIDKIRHA